MLNFIFSSLNNILLLKIALKIEQKISIILLQIFWAI